MLGKTDVKVSRPRDGRHCDLCGCSFPAVRCDKCGSQIFCLSCDDMYHRHPKRRFHLRKAVDPTPTPQARPVLPMKVSQLATTPGDPSKMPLPPPRKKKPGKSFFDSFRRGSPSSDNSPPLPKKEYSWSDRLGSIKKFMSNRPLPPLPKDEENDELKGSPPVPRKNDLSFIHKRVDEKPPQLPHRTQAKSPPPRKHSEGDVLSRNQEIHLPDKQAEWASGFGVPTNNFQQAPMVSPTQHLNGQANRDSSEREFSAGRFRSKSLQDDMSPTGLSPNFAQLPNLSPTMPPDVRGYSTLKRPPTHGQDLHNQSFMSMPGDHFHGMHTSSSVTDLHTLDSPSPRGPQQFPNFPMPPHYPHPYPMYPHYPNYPQYFGTSFANLSTVLPNADGDFSDHSDASSFSSKKPKHSSSFGIKAKRSQSVMYDRMAYPPQYYPFGGFPPHPPLPGYGAAHWGQSDHQAEEPASPATSVRSFGRSHRSRHRKKKMVTSDNDDEDDERLSVRSSPRSRTTSSSDRLRRRKTPKKFERSASPSSLTSSEEEEENQAKEDRLSPEEAHIELSQGDGYQTKQDKKKASKQAKDAGRPEHKAKQHASKIRATSHQKLKTDDKNFSPKVKKKEKEAISSSESMDVNEEHVVEAPGKAEDNIQVQQDAEMKEESDYHSEEDDRKETVGEEPRIESTFSENQWHCEHCTFINSSEHRICQVCCKTKPGYIPQSDPASLVVPEMQASSSAAASPILNTTSESLTSDTAKEYLTPPVPAEDDGHSGHSENEGQNIAKLNSDLEQAEKELSRGLMELMKLKEESEIANNAPAANRRSPEDIRATDSEVASQDTQTEPNPTAPQTETAFSQMNNNIEASNEQLNQQLNVPKIEHVTSKSIGTDSMDFDFKLQTHGPENVIAPTQKPLNFGLFTQDQISPANSFSEITASSPNQRDIMAKPTLRRDSSCQTYQDESSTQIESDIPTLLHGDSLEFQHQYNRADSMRSPQLPPIGPSGYRGFPGRGQGLMHRSHSRSSLFGDRYGDARNAPPEFDNLGFGFGPSPMYRSLSRSSLTGDYSDPWMSEVRSLRRPDFYLSMEELVERRRLETKRAQGLELVRMIREAEQQGFTADDIHVALNNCGKQNPVDWLQTNWKGMVDTVVTLATNYGKDKHENDIGVLSDNEARDALRMHKGNIWAAVTECVEGRQRKFLELRARGNFSTKEIVDALTQSEGNVELAYTRLSATTLKPFLMRIWGTGEGVENQDGAVPTEFLDPESSGWPKNSTLHAGNVPYGDNERCSDQEDWDDDDDVEEEVSWNEEEEEEMENPENFDIEPQIMRREKRSFNSNNIATPESDSEYCDAFDPVGDARSATSSSPVDEIFFVSPDTDLELQKDKKKGTSFLSRLAALRKNKKPHVDGITGKDASYREHNLEADSGDSYDTSDKNDGFEAKIRANDSTSSSSETNKVYSPLNILKQTFSAIKDSVIGSGNKNEAKHPRSITEARTIIVHDKGSAQETVPSEENTQKSINPDIGSESSRRVENKSESIPKLSKKFDSKANNIVDEHSKTLKSNSENKALPAKTLDDQIPSTSNSSEKRPVAKQQSIRNLELNAATSENAAGFLNNTQNNLELVRLQNKTEEEYLPVLTQPLPPKSVEEEITKEEKTLTADVSKQFQNTSISLTDDVKSNKSLAKEPVSKKSQEGKFPTQEKSSVVPEKTADRSNNKDESHPQTFSQTPAVKSASNKLGLETKAKNEIETDTSLQQVTDDVIDNVPMTNDVIEATEKPPELTVAKSRDEKPKAKKPKEGLRLKLPDHKKPASFEMQKDQAQPDKQNDEPLTKPGVTPKSDAYLEEKQNTIKEQSDKISANTMESRPVLAESDNGPRSDLFQAKPAEENSSSTTVSKEGEEKSVGEKSMTNISENEFHDMASKITEKMENCLEVLKASEAAFTESEETTPPRSEKKEEVSASGNVVQSKVDSSQPNSETPEVNVEGTATDASKIYAHHEGKNVDVVSVKSPSPSIGQNEIIHVNDVKLTNKEITEAITSPGKDVSADTVEHGAQDSKTSESPSTFNTTSDNKSVMSSSPHEISQTAARTTNVESPGPQIASLSPPLTNCNKLDEAPVEFAGVKAKTFTGLNKMPKNQLYGSDKKQKNNSVRSPTPQETPDATGSGKVSSNNKDFSDLNQIPRSKTGIQETENIMEPHQDETEQSVHSISTKGGTVSSANDQQSQTTSDEHKNETRFPNQALKDTSSDIVETQTKISNQAELIDTSSDIVATETKVINQAEQNKQESPQPANAAERKTEAKSDDANSESQAKTKEKKNALPATKSEPPVLSRFSARKFKDQDIKNIMPATSKESSVSASSKVTGFKAKEKDTKYVSTTTATNSLASVAAPAKSSDIISKVQEVKSVKDVADTETSVDTTNKGSDTKANEPDVHYDIATTSTEAFVSIPNEVSDIKTEEQDVNNVTSTAKIDTSVPTSSKVSDIKTEEQDVSNVTSTAKIDTSVPTSSKVSDIKAKEQDTRNSTSLAKTSEASVSIPSKSLGIKAKEEETGSATTAVSTETSISASSKSSDVKTEELDSKVDMATLKEEASAFVTKTDMDYEAKKNDTESISASANEASTSSSRNRARLRVEIQGETENSNVKEDSVPSSPVIFGDKRPTSRIEALKISLNEEREGRSQSPIRPQSPFGRMTSLTARREAIANERNREVRKTPTIEKKPWFVEKPQAPKPTFPKRSIKQQLEFERKIRSLVAERKCRTYRKAEIVVQLLELNFVEEEALQAAHECSNLEQAISYLQQECLLCTGMYPVGQIVSMIHCPHKACRECIKAYFTIQIRDRTIMELLCPFCNEPDISDEDVAQDYFNHLDILLKKLVESEIHELFQRKLRDRVLMKDPNFRWCSQCSSGFIAMPNLKRLICPDCNAITCAKCRRPWEREHEGVSCEAFAAWKDANDPEAQSAGLAKLLQEDGIDCPNCHFRYTLAKGGCMHFRCMQCQHDFCSGCSKPFKMGQKCGVSDFCVKLGLHAHHPRNCLFYLRDKDPEDLQRLLELNDIDYDKDPPEGMELKSVCQVMEQKETADGLVDDICGKEVQEKQAGLCRVHYVEYLGQLVNKHKIDPIQIFCNDDLELVLRRASKRLPAKSYRDTEIVYREKLVQLIQEELPLELTEGS